MLRRQYSMAQLEVQRGQNPWAFQANRCFLCRLNSAVSITGFYQLGHVKSHVSQRVPPELSLESTQKAERDASEAEEYEAQTSAHLSEPSRWREKTDRHGSSKLHGLGTVRLLFTVPFAMLRQYSRAMEEKADHHALCTLRAFQSSRRHFL
jgi:hypothetical protein